MTSTKKYLIYCRSGNRTGQTLAIMKNLGFQNVTDLAGGRNAWLKASSPEPEIITENIFL